MVNKTKQSIKRTNQAYQQWHKYNYQILFSNTSFNIY